MYTFHFLFNLKGSNVKQSAPVDSLNVSRLPRGLGLLAERADDHALQGLLLGAAHPRHLLIPLRLKLAHEKFIS
jgi:hypothetical protein